MFNPANMTFHGLPEGYSPKVFSKLIDKAWHDATVFTPCFNRKFDGEIKGYGSELVVRSEGETVAYDYVPGTPIATFEPEARARTIKVGRAWQSAREIREWEKVNVELKDWYDLKSAEVAAAATRRCETTWFNEADAELAASAFGSRNRGAKAGKNGNVNLGTIENPVVLSQKGPDAATTDNQKNVVEYLLDMRKVYSTNDGVGQGNPFVYSILPPEFTDLMERYQAFYHGSCLPPVADILKGSDTEVKGVAKGFTILESKRLPVVDEKIVNGTKYSVYPIFFGDSNAWTWTDLGTENGDFPSNDTPGKHTVWFTGKYDRWLDDPRYFCVGYVALP